MAEPEGERRELHCRTIEMRGFRRADGLYEVEGRLVDRKPELFRPLLGDRRVEPGEPLHAMGVRIVFDAAMNVIDVETFTEAAPYDLCPGGGDALKAMIGARMTAGWSGEIRRRLAHAHSCTHLVQLLGPMATVAFQSMSAERKAAPLQRDATGRPVKIDSCYAYGAGRSLVRRHWPEYHRPDEAG